MLSLVWLGGVWGCDAPTPQAGQARAREGGCGTLPESAELRERTLAECLTRDGAKLVTWSPVPANRPVTLYLDLSGSMRGFLDPAYTANDSTHFRRVIDRLVVGLAPTAAFGYGNRLRPVEPSLGVLGNRNTYSDNDTRLELALDAIARDSALGGSHVLVGDGRRGSPDRANAQFGRIRSAADRWIQRGGTFIVAASLAPFEPVRNDPAGCRRTDHASGGMPAQCPLYAIAFAAPGDEGRIADALSEGFEHLFIYPLPAVPSKALELRAAARAGLKVDRSWRRSADGSPIIRTGGSAAGTQAVASTITARGDSPNEARRFDRALQGQRVELDITYRALRPDELGRAWEPVSSRAAHVRPVADSVLGVELRTRGADAQRYLYRVQLVPSGVPTWLESFDAADANDAVRTYGLGTLFELFRQRAAAERRPAGRFYVVAN